jgi:hypothetical protein
MRSLHSGVWRSEDRADSRYWYLPVDVPPGARSLGVSLAYDAGAGVLDLGCLDPDGQFRGWSGGARSEFTITQRWATPGYLPGPVAPGSWRVVLGLHRVPPEGVSWTVTGEAALAVPVICPPHPASPGSPATCTPTPCTPTER